MKAEKDPLNGATMDVTKVHFSLFFLPFLKGNLSFFHSSQKQNSVLLSSVRQYVTELIHHFFFPFFTHDNDKWRNSAVTKSAL